MRNLFSTGPFFWLAVIISISLTRSAFSQADPSVTTPGSHVKLTYHYPDNKPVKYVYMTKVAQNMTVNGQPMLVNVNSYLRCNVRSSGDQGENLKLEIRLDSMAHKVESPQGVSGGSVSEARDKVFNLVISSSGKTIDLSEAAKIVFTSPGSGGSSAYETFINYFPSLPLDEISTGDKWVTHDTLRSKSQTASRWMPLESNCKLEGFENYKGFNCAKICTTVNGTMKLISTAQGTEVVTNGTVTGTKTLFFAIKEGYFVNEITTTKMTGTVEVQAQGLSIPIVMDINSTNEFLQE